MRPLFAIAPLAIVLSLIGPAPVEADQAIAQFKAQWLSPLTPAHVDHKQDLAAAKPVLSGATPSFNALKNAPSLEASLRR